MGLEAADGGCHDAKQRGILLRFGNKVPNFLSTAAQKMT
jgi:hypothetical protein